MTSTVHAEETTLPDILQSLKAGDEVIITSGAENKPVARIEAIASSPDASRRLGFLLNPKFVLPKDFFEEDLDGEEADQR